MGDKKSQSNILFIKKMVSKYRGSILDNFWWNKYKLENVTKKSIRSLLSNWKINIDFLGGMSPIRGGGLPPPSKKRGKNLLSSKGVKGGELTPSLSLSRVLLTIKAKNATMYVKTGEFSLQTSWLCIIFLCDYIQRTLPIPWILIWEILYYMISMQVFLPCTLFSCFLLWLKIRGLDFFFQVLIKAS